MADLTWVPEYLTAATNPTRAADWSHILTISGLGAYIWLRDKRGWLEHLRRGVIGVAFWTILGINLIVLAHSTDHSPAKPPPNPADYFSLDNLQSDAPQAPKSCLTLDIGHLKNLIEIAEAGFGSVGQYQCAPRDANCQAERLTTYRMIADWEQKTLREAISQGCPAL
jgi:hypothetical protein